MSPARWLLAGVLAALFGLAGCGPDFTLECAGDAPLLDGEPFSCERCFAALGCESAADEPIDCPTGIRGQCRYDGATAEYCCEGDCLSCP